MESGTKQAKSKNKIVSGLVIYAMVAASALVILPLETPNVEAPLPNCIHLALASLEDGSAPWDMDGMINGIVMWDPTFYHIINDPNGYTVDHGITLIIPGLDYGSPSVPASEWSQIEFQTPGREFHVIHEPTYAPSKLVIQSDMDPQTKTRFWATGGMGGGWDGMFFEANTEIQMVDTLIDGPMAGVNFAPGSILTSPLSECRFYDVKMFGLRMNGVVGATDIDNTYFYRPGGAPSNTGTGLTVSNGMLNLSSSVIFSSHGTDKPGLNISYAEPVRYMNPVYPVVIRIFTGSA